MDNPCAICDGIISVERCHTKFNTYSQILDHQLNSPDTMHFHLLEPLTANRWGSAEPSLRNAGLTYFMLPESLYFTLKKLSCFLCYFIFLLLILH